MCGQDLRRRLGISILAGFLAAAASVPHKMDFSMERAWWGVLYPEYCYMRQPEDIDKMETGEPVKIKIKFRWLHGL